MTGLLGFDPSTFTDDELLNKLTELNQRVVWAARFGSSDLVAQIQNLIAMIEMEQRERYLKMALAARNSMFPGVIETEPDLREEPSKEAKTSKKAQPRRAAPIRTVRPTVEPVSPPSEKQ